MTQRRVPSQHSLFEPARSVITDAELARVLRQIGAMFKSSEVNSVALGNALIELASWVSRRGEQSKPFRKQAYRRLAVPAEPPADLRRLKMFSRREVEAYLADPAKTKLELIDLAVNRFSIPRSQLMRLRANEVRETVRAAMLHEESIEIISDEAKREGSKRLS